MLSAWFRIKYPHIVDVSSIQNAHYSISLWLFVMFRVLLLLQLLCSNSKAWLTPRPSARSSLTTTPSTCCNDSYEASLTHCWIGLTLSAPLAFAPLTSKSTFSARALAATLLWPRLSVFAAPFKIKTTLPTCGTGSTTPSCTSITLDTYTQLLTCFNSYMAMTDYPYPTGFLQPLPGWPVEVACAQVMKVGAYHSEVYGM